MSNHSGGLMNFGLSVFAVDYYQKCGYERPLYVLAHDSFFRSPDGSIP
ncbi:hypothetical protein [Mycobacterium sp. ZZG]